MIYNQRAANCNRQLSMNPVPENHWLARAPHSGCFWASIFSITSTGRFWRRLSRRFARRSFRLTTERDGAHRGAGHGVSRHLHDIGAGAGLARRSLPALGDRRNLRHSLEFGQRCLRLGHDFRITCFHPHLRWDRRRWLRTCAPTILADLYPLKSRGRVLAIFCAAIPVGSALGYVLGGLIKVNLDWRWAFYLVTPPGLLLGLLCFTRRDPRGYGATKKKQRRATWDDYVTLFRTPSYVFNTLAQTAMTFAIGGLVFGCLPTCSFDNNRPRRCLFLEGSS